MGSRPPRQVIYRPTPTAATIYQSVIPEEDFTNLSNYIDDLKAQRAQKTKETEALGYGVEEMAKRDQQRREQETNTYRASLPKKPFPDSRYGAPGTTKP